MYPPAGNFHPRRELLVRLNFGRRLYFGAWIALTHPFYFDIMDPLPLPAVQLPLSACLVSAPLMAPPVLTTGRFLPVAHNLSPPRCASPVHRRMAAADEIVYNQAQHVLDLDRLTQQELANQDLLEQYLRVSSDNKDLRKRLKKTAHDYESLEAENGHLTALHEEAQTENLGHRRVVDAISYLIDSTRTNNTLPANLSAHLRGDNQRASNNLRNVRRPTYDEEDEEEDGEGEEEFEELGRQSYADDDVVYLGTRRRGESSGEGSRRRRQASVDARMRRVFGDGEDGFNSDEIAQSEGDLPKEEEMVRA